MIEERNKIIRRYLIIEFVSIPLMIVAFLRIKFTANDYGDFEFFSVIIYCISLFISSGSGTHVSEKLLKCGLNHIGRGDEFKNKSLNRKILSNKSKELQNALENKKNKMDAEEIKEYQKIIYFKYLHPILLIVRTIIYYCLFIILSKLLY